MTLFSSGGSCVQNIFPCVFEGRYPGLGCFLPSNSNKFPCFPLPFFVPLWVLSASRMFGLRVLFFSITNRFLYAAQTLPPRLLSAAVFFFSAILLRTLFLGSPAASFIPVLLSIDLFPLNINSERRDPPFHRSCNENISRELLIYSKKGLFSARLFIVSSSIPSKDSGENGPLEDNIFRCIMGPRR